MARKKEGPLPRRHSRLRLGLLTGAFLLALLPHSSAPTSASVRASGDIVASDASFTSDASGAVDAGQLFDRVGLHWIARGEQERRVEIRTSTDAVTWTDWSSLTDDEDMYDAERGEHYAPVFAVPVSRYAQYRVSDADQGAIERVTLTFMDVNDRNQGPVVRLLNDVAGGLTAMWQSYAEAAPLVPRTFTRQDWGASESLMTWPARYQRVQKAIIHHTVTDDGGSNVAATIRGIYYYHAVTRGWGDIGYSYLVDKSGNIWTGRQGGDHTIAGHAYGWNNGTIGIAAIGDYSGVQPTTALQNAIANIIAVKFAQFGIQPYGADPFVHQEQSPDGSWVSVSTNAPNILAHRDANYILSQHGGQTACPGTIYAMMDGLRRLVQAGIQGGYMNLVYLDPNLPKAGTPGATLQVPVSIANRGVTAIPAGTAVSYRVLSSGAVAVAQGGATTLQTPIAPGAVATVTVPFNVPAFGNYLVRWDLQSGGQWWNALYGGPARDMAFRSADWSADWISDTVPPSWTAGEQRVVSVTVANDGGRVWPATGTNPVRLGYKWVSNSTGNTFPGASFTSLPFDVQPGQQITLPIPVTVPQYPTNYTMYLDLYKQNEFAFAEKGIAPDDTPTGVSVDFKASYAPTPAAFTAGQVTNVPVTITNLGKGVFPVTSSFPVNLGYHWYGATGQTVLWDGARTKLPADLGPGQSVTVTAQVAAPQAGGAYRLAFDLVQEGVGWFSARGVATSNTPITVVGPTVTTYGATYQPGASTLAFPGAVASVPITVTNASSFVWPAAGANPITLSYHWSSTTGQTIVWDGARTRLGADVPPGASAQLQAGVTMPSVPGDYTLRWDLVHEGVTWFSGKGVRTFDQPVNVSPQVQLFYGGSIDASRTPATLATSLVATIPVRAQNLSNFDFGADVNLSYHWYDAAGQTVAWDGLRTSLAGLRVGEVRAVSAPVQVPPVPGSYTLRWDMVREGVSWFSSTGMQTPAVSIKVDVPQYGAIYVVPPSAAGQAGGITSVPIIVTNSGSQTWIGGQYNVSYHIYTPSGDVLVWDGARTALPGSVATGQTASAQAQLRLPAQAGTYLVRVDIVVEGVLWFSGAGVPAGSFTLVAQ